MTLARATLFVGISLASIAGPVAAQPALPRLSGTVIGNGERRAILAKPDGSFESVAEGGQLDGYIVIRIIPGSVWIRSLHDTFVLNLTEDASIRVNIAPNQQPPPLSEAERQADEDNNR